MPSGHQSTSTRTLVISNGRQSNHGSSADVVTFQYKKTCVFVKLAENYEQALDIAQKEYDELHSIPRERIGFSLDDVNHAGRHVRISESAWSSITPKLSRGTIINIIIRPDADSKVPPPQYLEVPDAPAKDNYVPDLSGSAPVSRTSSRASIRSTKSTSKLFTWLPGTSGVNK